jgi:hypothetical protein
MLVLQATAVEGCLQSCQPASPMLPQHVPQVWRHACQEAACGQPSRADAQGAQPHRHKQWRAPADQPGLRAGKPTKGLVQKVGARGCGVVCRAREDWPTSSPRPCLAMTNPAPSVNPKTNAERLVERNARQSASLTQRGFIGLPLLPATGGQGNASKCAASHSWGADARPASSPCSETVSVSASSSVTSLQMSCALAAAC